MATVEHLWLSLGGAQGEIHNDEKNVDVNHFYYYKLDKNGMQWQSKVIVASKVFSIVYFTLDNIYRYSQAFTGSHNN